MKRFKLTVSFLLICSLFLGGCSSEPKNITSFGPKVVIGDNSKSVKDICYQVFEKYLTYLQGKNISDEMRIIDYKIDQIKVEQIINGTNGEAKYIFSSSYSILPASKRFSLSESGVKLDNGWIEQKFHVFEITKNKNTYRITGIATGN